MSPALPRPGEGKRGVEGHLIYLLRQASAAVRLALDRILAEHGLTSPQYSALTMIASYPIMSSADLARLTLLTPQTVSVIVRNLERRGAIIRLPDAVHRRIQRLELTPSGRALLKTCRAKSDEIERAMSSLPPGDPKVIKAWLVAVATGFSGGEVLLNDHEG
jgi:DNA-binding MarR family transcriptional regulator